MLQLSLGFAQPSHPRVPDSEALSDPQEKGQGCSVMGPTSPLLQQHGDSGGRIMMILPPPLLESTWGCFYPISKALLSVLLGLQSWVHCTDAGRAVHTLQSCSWPSWLCEPSFPAPRSVPLLMGAAWGGVDHSAGAARSLHVPTKARFTNLPLRFCSVSKQPEPASGNGQPVFHGPQANRPLGHELSHESSKDIANPPVAQGSSPGPSS